MTTPAAVPSSWYVEHAIIPEIIVPGKRLGRQVRHDSRNRLYPHIRRDRALTSQLWARHIPILDQGNVGSCTGNMMTGALGTDPLIGALPAAHPALDEALALVIYSGAETLDGDGPYPPNDNGSSGPSVDQVAKNDGFISGYTHAFDLASLLDALEDGPVGIGINWYQGMDSPDSSGLVTISGSIRGGHEVLVRGKDVTAQLIHCDNSWGTGFGVNGSFDMGWATIERLLAEQGDVTVPIPLTVPAPQPVPVPPVPPDPPNPGPVPQDPDAADRLLFRQVSPWLRGHHVGINAQLKADLQGWVRSKGF